jgi:SAM-dependent methyltransferase
VSDAIFAHPRLARVYDAFDGPRDDLAAYVAIAGELGADRVLDVGCGTGCLAIALAGTGRTVIAVDPAAASLTVARAKDGAVITSDSTLRFRGRGELESSLAAQGYRVLDVRDAPDRPGREFVFITERTT